VTLGRPRWPRTIVVLLALIGVFAHTSSTTAPAAAYTYDAHTIARAGVHDEAVRTVSPQFTGLREESRSADAVITSTTPSARSVATEAAPFGELANPATVNNAGSPIRSFVTEADTTYLRVYSGDKTAGGFLVGSTPSSADSAVSGLALPPGNNADFIQEVLVPSGTRLQSSIAARAFGQPGGLLQFELLDQIPVKNFGPGLPFR
jgi:hypothetical protein